MSEKQTDKSKNVKTIKVIAAPTARQEIERQREQRERRNNLYSIIWLIIMCVLTIGSGIALVTIGSRNSIDDLLILGSICLLAGVVFLFLIILAVSRPYRQNKSRVNAQRKEEDSNDTDENVEYVKDIDTKVEDPTKVFKKTKPTQKQLYGREPLIIHLPESDETLPLPVVVVPNSEHDFHKPVLKMPLDKVAKASFDDRTDT